MDVRANAAILGLTKEAFGVRAIYGKKAGSLIGNSIVMK